MFTIYTAKPGEAYHTLIPTKRLIEVDKDYGSCAELRLMVREAHEPGKTWEVRFYLDDAFDKTSKPVEIIPREELLRRIAQAEENGDIYSEQHVCLYEACSSTAAYALSLRDHFLYLMESGQFCLPTTY